jgi:hypothetical protein
VIAYDILTHLWQEMHWLHTKPEKPEQPRYHEMRTRLESAAGSVGEFDSFRKMQKELLREEQSLGMPWKISDFVTVGSPLTYADYLLADHRTYPIARKITDRELPTCPPQLEDGRDVGYLSPSYRLQDGTLATKKLLHHAALFACTRWTNIYFHSDIIGGEIKKHFGNGVKEVPISGKTSSGKTLLSHTMYWNEHEDEACKAIKDAMGLDEI